MKTKRTKKCSATSRKTFCCKKRRDNTRYKMLTREERLREESIFRKECLWPSESSFSESSLGNSTHNTPKRADEEHHLVTEEEEDFPFDEPPLSPAAPRSSPLHGLDCQIKATRLQKKKLQFVDDAKIEGKQKLKSHCRNNNKRQAKPVNSPNESSGSPGTTETVVGSAVIKKKSFKSNLISVDAFIRTTNAAAINNNDDNASSSTPPQSLSSVLFPSVKESPKAQTLVDQTPPQATSPDNTATTVDCTVASSPDFVAKQKLAFSLEEEPTPSQQQIIAAAAASADATENDAPISLEVVTETTKSSQQQQQHPQSPPQRGIILAPSTQDSDNENVDLSFLSPRPVSWLNFEELGIISNPQLQAAKAALDAEAAAYRQQRQVVEKEIAKRQDLSPEEREMELLLVKLRLSRLRAERAARQVEAEE